MNKIVYPLLVITLVLSCCSCKSSKKCAQSGKYPLVGTQWNLVALEGVELDHDFAMRPFVTFDTAGHISGNLGCNSFFGSYETTKKHKMTVNYDGSTKRLCQQMGVEKQFSAAWRMDINRYEIKGNELILYSGVDEIMRFSGTDLSKSE